MKRVNVNEKCAWVAICAKYYCAFANSGETDMVKALKNIKINPKHTDRRKRQYQLCGLVSPL